jgi:hypothetical protein
VVHEAELSEETSLQALNATHAATLRTQALGESDDDLLPSVVGVLSNLLVKAEALRRYKNVRPRPTTLKRVWSGTSHHCLFLVRSRIYSQPS